jgi:PAS domain S-box-containing protein
MLDKGNKNLLTIFEAMEDGIYIVGDDYHIEFMNKAMVRDFGIGTGKPCYRVISGQDDRCSWCRAERVFEGEILHWQHCVPGTDKIYDIIDVPFRNVDGTALKLGIWRDRTLRNKREKRIEASEEEYRRLFEHVGCGVYISSKDGKFLNANPALLNMLGYTGKEEFLKIDITGDLYLRPEDRKKFQEMIEAEGQVIDYEVDFRRKDGRSVSVLLTSHVRYGEDGEVAGYEGIIVDQTQRKEMERDLKKTKEFLSKIISSSVNPIIVADMKGRILLINESGRELFGYALGAWKSTVKDFYLPGKAKSMMEKLRSPGYGGVGKLNPTEVTVRAASGEEIPVEMTASIIYDEDGREIATMAIFRDLRPKIESEKELEKARVQLVQSVKLASLGRLAAGVAHEINNPLGGIIMYSHLALEDLPEDIPAHKNLKKLIVQAERCKRIVQGLLDFSRQPKPKIESIKINDLIEEVLSLVEAQALFQNIEVTKALDPAIPLISGDKTQFQQVFINLVLNAAEAMEKGGRLIVESSLRNESVEIRLTDTGRGIPPEDREKIFEPFFTTKSDMKGTGLGLAVSHGVITKHGGAISFESNVNGGTTFIVRLPVESQEGRPC